MQRFTLGNSSTVGGVYFSTMQDNYFSVFEPITESKAKTLPNLPIPLISVSEMARDTCGNGNHKIWNKINHGKNDNQQSNSVAHIIRQCYQVWWGSGCCQPQLSTSQSHSAFIAWGCCSHVSLKHHLQIPPDFSMVGPGRAVLLTAAQDRDNKPKQTNSGRQFLASSHECKAVRKAGLVSWAYVVQLPVWMPIYGPPLCHTCMEQGPAE